MRTMPKFFLAALLFFAIISISSSARGWSEENSEILDDYYADLLDEKIEAYYQAGRREADANLRKFGMTLQKLESNPEKTEELYECMDTLGLAKINDKIGHCLEDVFGQGT